VSIVVVVVVVVVSGAKNVVVNDGNVVDFHDCPSSIRKCFHPFMDAQQLLESWYHFLKTFTSVISSIFLMEMTSVVLIYFAYLLVLMLAL
jgi:hypothetical protein